jgi:prepilin-type N-terminal cleavage/methylation domain-containing protein
MNSRSKTETKNGAAGFSLLELLIALTITLAIMAAATTLLATSLRTRTRENKRSEALTDAQRALGMMSREIGNSGYGLTDNGIATVDSGPTSIRVRANLDNNSTLAFSNSESDEDVRYVFQSGNKTIVRFARVPTPDGLTTVMANGVTFMELSYFDSSGVAITDVAQYNRAERVKIEILVELPATMGIPASVVGLVSDVTLRNAPNTLQQF